MGTVRLRALGCALLCLACGCGGGGGGGVGGPGVPVTVLASLLARLSGASETVVVDPDAAAVAVLELRSDGTLRFAVTVDASFAGIVTGMHVHRGAAGIDGAIVVDLLSGGVTVDPATRTADGTKTIGTALANEIAGNPAGFYVNVHTSTAAAGLVRGQLGDFLGADLHAILRGSEEVTVVDPAARAAASILVDDLEDIEFIVAAGSPLLADLTLAHIHSGPPGANGGIVVDLGGAPGAVRNDALGTLSGSAAATLETIARLLLDPAGLYVNVHTAAAPNGIARGQLGGGAEEVWARLEGDQETTVVDAGAAGAVALQLLTPTAGRMMLAVPPAQQINLVTGAHIHEGNAGADGAIVIDLFAGADLNKSGPSSSAEGSIAYDRTLYCRLLARPQGFYGNVHTAGAPNGLARGQLGQTPESFFAALSGAEETTVVNPAAAGTLSLVLTGAASGSFVVRMTTPPAADITFAHVHDGAPGVNGPPLMDLLGGTFTLAGNTISGEFHFTGRTFVRLLSNAPLFYGNVHTAAAPNGIARGQMQLRSDDTAPTGLAYASPVVYTSGQAITPNVPTSGGGSVAVYTVAPALPAGLSLDAASGVISGTPTAATPAAGYTVTASNAAGSTTFVVNITVNLAPPAGLSYTTPVTYVVGTAITANSPASTGGPISSYGVSPALPAGLAIHATTGVISGTPTAATAAANYTVTGTNVSGSTQATVNITVASNLQAPSGLSYGTPVSWSTGSAIPDHAPTIGGGPVSTWTISPSLPAGLSFSASTGVISGTPTAVTTAATYTVTASNAAGSTQATLSIATPLGAPTNLSYDNTPNIGYVTQAITSMSPTSEGGAVASYSISPALPSGLSLDTTTGVISGTPNVTSALATYTVTATNATGSTTASVQIVVY